MELLVATWSVRLAMLGAVAAGGLSLSVGATPIEAVGRAAAAAFTFTLGGRLLLARLETPDQRLHRLRAARSARTGGKGTDKGVGKGDKGVGKGDKAAGKKKPAAKTSATKASENIGTGRPADKEAA